MSSGLQRVYCSYLRNYVRNGVFPNKYTWKRTCKSSVKDIEAYLWHSRLSDEEFSQFSCIHPVFRESIIWSVSKYDPSFTMHCQNVISLISRLNAYEYEKLCCKCGSLFTKDVEHCLFRCPYLDDIRTRFKLKLETVFGSTISEFLYSLRNEVYIGVLLGSPNDDLYNLLNDNYIDFFMIGIKHVSDLWHSFVHL